MKGSTADVDLDYFRAEYSGRNMGVTVEFEENVSKATDVADNKDCGFNFDMKPYSHKILFIR